MSQKTVGSDRDITELEPAVVRSNKRRNAVFMGAHEHVRLMKLIEEEDCEIFAQSPTHSASSHSQASSLTQLELFDEDS